MNQSSCVISDDMNLSTLYISDDMNAQGKYARCLYCNHVTKCFISKCVIQAVMYSNDHEVGAKLYITIWMTHLETKHFVT